MEGNLEKGEGCTMQYRTYDIILLTIVAMDDKELWLGKALLRHLGYQLGMHIIEWISSKLRDKFMYGNQNLGHFVYT